MNSFQKVIIEGFKQEFCVLNAPSDPDKLHERLLRTHRSYVISHTMQMKVRDGKFTILPKVN